MYRTHAIHIRPTCVNLTVTSSNGKQLHTDDEVLWWIWCTFQVKIVNAAYTHTQKSWNDTNSSWHFPLKNDESEEDSVVGKSLDVGTHFQRHGLCDCYCCCCCGCSCCCYRKVDLPTGKQWIWFYTKHLFMCWGVTVSLIDTQCFCFVLWFNFRISMHVSFIFMLY